MFTFTPTHLFRTAAIVSIISAIGCSSSQPKTPPSVPSGSQVLNEQYTFESPQDAALALADAAGALNGPELNLIFGPDVGDLSSGDPTQDDINLQQFAAAYDRQYTLNETTPGVATLFVGEDAWELPIPIVQRDGRWVFDTPAGVEELRKRRIGRNELDVMAVCADLVAAQRQFFAMDPDGDGINEYAVRFKSTDGRRDGLYWPSTDGAPESPLGPLAAAAYQKGELKKDVEGQAYRGYYYRVLTERGASAPGGARSYLDDKGRMTVGFAIIAWPAVYGETGVMTFVVAEDAVVYQRDLGDETVSAAIGIAAFDPGQGWSRAQ